MSMYSYFSFEEKLVRCCCFQTKKSSVIVSPIKIWNILEVIKVIMFIYSSDTFVAFVQV